MFLFNISGKSDQHKKKQISITEIIYAQLTTNIHQPQKNYTKEKIFKKIGIGDLLSKSYLDFLFSSPNPFLFSVNPGSALLIVNPLSHTLKTAQEPVLIFLSGTGV